jgi:toxin HigB-1
MSGRRGLTTLTAPRDSRCASTAVPRVDGLSVSVYRTLVIRSFADGTTADLWAERNSKPARRIPRELWPVVYRKLTMLDSAQRLEDLAAVPGNRLEALAGNRKGRHSIRVNQQYRVTFRWENNDAYEVCCEDYH